ncbi:MAG: hypothetical protein WCA32_22890, partial [Chromatiaceae bacterium]
MSLLITTKRPQPLGHARTTRQALCVLERSGGDDQCRGSGSFRLVRAAGLYITLVPGLRLGKAARAAALA